MIAQLHDITFQQLGVGVAILVTLLTVGLIVHKVYEKVFAPYVKRTEFEALLNRVNDMQRSNNVGAEARQEKMLRFIEEFVERQKRHKR